MKKITIIFVAILLMIISFFLFIKEEKSESNFQKREIEVYKIEGTEDSFRILKAKEDITFEIEGQLDEGIVIVQESTNSEVDINIETIDEGYRIVNLSNYLKGESYTLKLPDGVYFLHEDLIDARSVTFEIERDETLNVEYSDNFLDLTSSEVVDFNIRNLTIKGEVKLEPGSVIMINNIDQSHPEVYGVSSSKISNGSTIIEYENVEMEDIFKSIDIYKDFEITSDQIQIYQDQEIIILNDKLLSSNPKDILQNSSEKDVTVKAKIEKIHNGTRIKVTASKYLTKTKKIDASMIFEMSDFMLHYNIKGWGDITTTVSFKSKLSYSFTTGRNEELFKDNKEIQSLVSQLKNSSSSILNYTLDFVKIVQPIFGPIYFDSDFDFKINMSGGVDLDYGTSEVNYVSFGVVLEDFYPVEIISFAEKNVESDSASFVGVLNLQIGLLMDGGLHFTQLLSAGLEVFTYGYLELNGGFIAAPEFEDLENWKGIFSIEAGVGIDTSVYAKFKKRDDTLQATKEFNYKKKLLYYDNNLIPKEVHLNELLPVTDSTIRFDQLIVTYIDQLGNDEFNNKIDIRSLKVELDDKGLSKSKYRFDVKDYKIGQEYILRLKWNYYQTPMQFEKNVILADAKYLDFYWLGYDGDEGLESFSDRLMFPRDRLAVQVEGLWGYIDQNESFVIEPQYDIAFAFDSFSGLALVGQNGKYGYIDQDGNEKIPMIYEDARGFNNGYGAVKLNGSWGFIDVSGDYLFEPVFQSVGDFIQISFDGKAAAKVQQDGLYGYVLSSGDYMIRPQFSFTYAFTTDGYAFYRGSNGLHGVISSNGILVTKPLFSYFWGFESGYAGVGIVENDSVVYGIINKKGNYVLDPIYPRMTKYEDGYIIATQMDWNNGHEFAIADLTGRFVNRNIQTDNWMNVFSWPTSYSEGVYAFDDGESNWSFYNSRGDIVSRTNIPLSIREYPGGAIQSIGSLSNGATWYLDQVEFDWENMDRIDYTAKIGYINKSGKVIADAKFDSLSTKDFMVCGFSDDGFALVKQGGFGVISTGGNLIINTNYKAIQVLKNR